MFYRKLSFNLKFLYIFILFIMTILLSCDKKEIEVSGETPIKRFLVYNYNIAKTTSSSTVKINLLWEIRAVLNPQNIKVGISDDIKLNNIHSSIETTNAQFRKDFNLYLSFTTGIHNFKAWVGYETSPGNGRITALLPITIDLDKSTIDSGSLFFKIFNDDFGEVTTSSNDDEVTTEEKYKVTVELYYITDKNNSKVNSTISFTEITTAMEEVISFYDKYSINLEIVTNDENNHVVKEDKINYVIYDNIDLPIANTNGELILFEEYKGPGDEGNKRNEHLVNLFNESIVNTTANLKIFFINDLKNYEKEKAILYGYAVTTLVGKCFFCDINTGILITNRTSTKKDEFGNGIFSKAIEHEIGHSLGLIHYTDVDEDKAKRELLKSYIVSFPKSNSKYILTSAGREYIYNNFYRNIMNPSLSGNYFFFTDDKFDFQEFNFTSSMKELNDNQKKTIISNISNL